MIVASVRVRVPEERRHEVARAFVGLLGPTRVEAGCIRCGAHADLEDRSVFGLDVSWATRSDLTRHLRSETFRTVLALIELSSEPPEIRFDTVHDSEGLDLITVARHGGKSRPSGDSSG